MRLTSRHERGSRIVCALCLAVFLSVLFTGVYAPASHASGFAFLKGLFVKEVKGYGIYTEESGSRFEKGSKVTVYLEADGFHNKKNGQEYEINLSLDLLLKDDKGNVGIEQKNVVISSLTVKSPWRDFYFTVNIDLAELPPGKYTLGFVATDHGTGDKASRDMDIEIY
ncbi:MAG: hypothetical protein ACOX5A_05375 [Aminivibrio sp.]|nr:hypothetical protein [Synergistaceae bacterium]